MDWDSIREEAIIHLQNLIRIDTTNPPGNEIKAVTYLKEVLQKEGIESQVFEPAPQRGNLIASFRGNGSKRPLLLTSHLDVVPANKEKWQVDPFSGELKEGEIWGRGAIDMKQMTVMELMVFLMAKRNNLSLPRDLIFAAVADEEEGCNAGTGWLVGNKPELLDAEYALNEVGGFSLPIDGHVFYPIGVAEKGLCWFKIVAHGDPGHGSLPHDNQALVKLAAVARRLGGGYLPFHRHPISHQFVNGLASHLKFPKSWGLKALLNRFLHPLALNYLIRDQKQSNQFYSLFHNTVSPTVFNSGNKINVIPAKASIEVDGRIVPGETVEYFLAEVKKMIGSGFDIEILKAWDPPPVSDQDGFYDLLCKTLIGHDPAALPLPYIIPGFTDASQYSRLGIKCYGFSPVKLDKGTNFADLFHGNNERIPVEGFMFGLKVLWDVVRGA